MDDRILVKFSATESCIKMKTVSRSQKSPHSFIAARCDFDTLERDGYVVVQDMASFASFQKNRVRGTVAISFTWLSNHGDQYVGWKQSVELPYNALIDFVKHSTTGQRTWNILSIEPQNCPRLVFECPNQLHKCIGNKIIRRKLVRFLRDHFKWWHVEKICFYGDFLPYSFSFREICNGKPGVVGGLIYHSDGDLSTGCYSIHT